MDKTNEQNDDFTLFNEMENSNKNIQNNPQLEKDDSNKNHNSNASDTPTTTSEATLNNENKTNENKNSINEKKYKEMKELKESNYYKLIVKGNIIDVYYDDNWYIGKIIDLNDNGDIKIKLIENRNHTSILNTNFLANQENFTYFRNKTKIYNNNYIDIKNEEECNKFIKKF